MEAARLRSSCLLYPSSFSLGEDGIEPVPPPFPGIRLEPDPEPAGPEGKELTDAEDASERKLDWDDMNLRKEGVVAKEERGGRCEVDDDDDESDAEDDDCLPVSAEEETSLRRFDDGPSWTAPRKDARAGVAQTIGKPSPSVYREIRWEKDRNERPTAFLPCDDYSKCQTSIVTVPLCLPPPVLETKETQARTELQQPPDLEIV